MLPPDYFDAAGDELIELYSRLDQSILQDIVRRIVKTGRMTDTAVWQAQRLQDSGTLMQDIIREVAQTSNASAAHVKALFEDAGVQAMQYDFSIYEAAGLTPLPLLQSPAAAQVLQAAIAKTAGHLHNLTMTTASSGQQAYIEAATLAETQVESGAFDYVTAIRNAVRSAAQAGSTVIYPSGHTDQLDVAIRRAALTGVNQTAAQLSLRYADDMDCDLVETTAHPGARPTHAVWQGRVFSRSGNRGRYPDFAGSTGYGTGAGLCGWNCRHSFFPYFDGLSETAYPRSKLAEYESRTVEYNGNTIPYYQATQLQRGMERGIRATKRELAGYGEGIKSDDEKIRNAMRGDYDKASVKLKRQEAKLKDFTQKTGLDRQREREQTLGFGRSQAQTARQAAEKHYRQWTRGIGAGDAAPKTLAKYYTEKYNNSPAHTLLTGYNRAVNKGDISPLVGLRKYQSTARDIESRLMGVTTSTGVKIEGYSMHFVDRVIGQTATPHPGMRAGVSIEDAREALLHPKRLGSIRTMADGDVRQTYYGESATVTISIRDKRLVQTNPK